MSEHKFVCSRCGAEVRAARYLTKLSYTLEAVIESDQRYEFSGVRFVCPDCEMAFKRFMDYRKPEIKEASHGR